MWRRLEARVRAVVARARRLERREIRTLLAWLENTRNLVHVSILLFVPFLIAAVSVLSGTLEGISFLLFPPLASATYTLFSEPEGRFASPWRFVGGLSVGAICGWAALEAGAIIYGVPISGLEVDAAGAAFAVFLAGVATWLLDLEEPAAFSTALLVLVTKTSQLAYVVSVFLSSAFVAGVFLLWRKQFFEQRAEYLYASTQGDDHVLVPWRGDEPLATARLAAHVAAAHETAKVVLFGTVDAEDTDGSPAVDAEGVPLSDGGEIGDEAASAEPTLGLDVVASELEAEFGVPCEVLVAATEDGTASAGRVLQAVHDANCDLVVTPYETQDGRLSPFVHDLFHSDTDTLVHRSADGRERWPEVLVPVRKAGDVAHKMIDFAARIAGEDGGVSVCHCVATDGDRDRAERMLGDLVETVPRSVETRIARADIESYLDRVSFDYDLIVIGSSSDRSAASRFVSRPTFERIEDLPCDVAVLDRNFRY
ncbi:HPP family protein [Salinirubellus sp. GCM10025818]|uniref:HPP family protein n=1 Tax=Salinirubellus TaxID=2162630 RepID=UPI0030CD9E69